jgi:glycerol-3-phosphate dehydrogenase
VQGRLDQQTRADALAAARSGRFDLVVVGGGVVGCGVALDAASRGLSVLLLERDDLGAGASSRSSRLVHGGLRYLEQFDFVLVQEALAERARLLELAPHLVRPLRFLYPLEQRGFESAYVRLGLTLYDALAGRRRGVPRHRSHGREQLRALAPGLKPTFTRAFEYWDACVDDARLTVTLARTAASLDAQIATRVEVTGLVLEGDATRGVRAHDRLTGETFEVSCHQVVCAVGAETELFLRRQRSNAPVRIAPSKGAHIVVPRDCIASDAALIARTRDSVVLVVPWSNHWIVGTTDTPWSDPAEQPTLTQEDVGYLLDQANRLLARPLTAHDVVGGYTGLRPLVATRGEVATTRLSREHAVVRADPGLVLVAGGKLTTYRTMARAAVDAAFAERRARLPASRTHELPLAGCTRPDDVRELTLDGVEPAVREHLVRRYGTLAADVAALADDAPTLLDAIPGAPGYLGADALYAVTHEGAVDLEDVLVRRTHIAVETRDHGLEAATSIATLIAPVLDWDASRVEDELSRYPALVDPSAPRTAGANLNA